MTACGAYARVRHGCDNSWPVYRGGLGLDGGAALEVCAVTYINTDDQIAAIRDVLDEAEACDIRVGDARAALAMLERLRAEAKARSAVYVRRDAWLSEGRREDRARYIEHHYDSWPNEGVTHEIELYELGDDCEWYRVSGASYRGSDYLSALEKALDAVGAP